MIRSNSAKTAAQGILFRKKEWSVLDQGPPRIIIGEGFLRNTSNKAWQRSVLSHLRKVAEECEPILGQHFVRVSQEMLPNVELTNNGAACSLFRNQESMVINIDIKTAPSLIQAEFSCAKQVANFLHLRAIRRSNFGKFPNGYVELVANLSGLLFCEVKGNLDEIEAAILKTRGVEYGYERAAVGFFVSQQRGLDEILNLILPFRQHLDDNLLVEYNKYLWTC